MLDLFSQAYHTVDSDIKGKLDTKALPHNKQDDLYGQPACEEQGWHLLKAWELLRTHGNIKCLQETPLLTQIKQNFCLQPLLNNSEMEMKNTACYKDCLGRLRSFMAITTLPEKQQGRTFLAHILSTIWKLISCSQESYRDAVTQVESWGNLLPGDFKWPNPGFWPLPKHKMLTTSSSLEHSNILNKIISAGLNFLQARA